MPDFADLIPFVDRTRWLMFQACASEGVDAKKFAADMGLSDQRVRDILFSNEGGIKDMNLREIAHWFHFSVGTTPEFTMTPRGRWHSDERPL
ncbi:hypothetical protein G6L37_05510 [Agrobacterium rubi]|nr:hypothetical protein [Agrobacterium rubi]NTF24815.1 hypothetical protein [Agrobacterium rubi]